MCSHHLWHDGISPMKRELYTQNRQHPLGGNHSPPIDKDAMPLKRKPSNHVKIEGSQSHLSKAEMECVGGIPPMYG